MSKVTRFEDLIAWQKLRELAKTVYQTTSMGGLRVAIEKRKDC